MPEAFRFAVKAPRWTMRRLDTVQERVRVLGERLGCIRLVVPTPRDDGLLELLLGSVDPAIRWALDLRDDSWDGVEARLADVGAVRVDDWQAPAGWCYLRFRDPPYDETALDRLAAGIRPLVDATPTCSRSSATRTSRRRLATHSGSASCSPEPSDDQSTRRPARARPRGTPRVCRSTSASVVAGDMSAMLWNGVSRMPRLSA